jgi:hypothetical protein
MVKKNDFPEINGMPDPVAEGLNPPSPENVLAAVSQVFNVPQTAILTHRRQDDLIQARSALAYIVWHICTEKRRKAAAALHRQPWFFGGNVLRARERAASDPSFGEKLVQAARLAVTMANT